MCTNKHSSIVRCQYILIIAMHADSTSNHNFLKQFSLTYHTHMNVHIHTLTEHTSTHTKHYRTHNKAACIDLFHVTRKLRKNILSFISGRQLLLFRVLVYAGNSSCQPLVWFLVATIDTERDVPSVFIIFPLI